MFFQLKMPSILAAVLFWTVLPELLFASTDPLTAKVVLFPFRQATISSRVESTLESYHYKIGDAFETDAVLLQLDDAIYKQQLEKAAAALAEAQSSYDFSVSNVNASNDVFSLSSPHSQTQRNWLCTVNESFPAGTLFSPDTLTTVPQCVAVSHAGWTLFRCDACAAL